MQKHACDFLCVTDAFLKWNWMVDTRWLPSCCTLPCQRAVLAFDIGQMRFWCTQDSTQDIPTCALHIFLACPRHHLRNSLNHYVFEHRSGCCAAEPGYVGVIGAIEIWWIDWFIHPLSNWPLILYVLVCVCVCAHADSKMICLNWCVSL